MNRFTYCKAVNVLVVALVLLSVTGLGTGSSLAAPKALQSRNMWSPVILRWDPTFSNLQIPPPQTFSGLRVQTATIIVNYVPNGTQNPAGDTCYTWPAAAQTAFRYAADIWETLINSSVPIEINACWTSLGEGVLGYGGAVTYHHSNEFTGEPYADTWYQATLANSIAGSDLNDSDGYDDDGDGSDADDDMILAYSQDFDWYFGTDGNPPYNQMDFASVVLHEICHGLGFSGSMKVSSGRGWWGIYSTTYPVIYDRFAENGAGTALLNFPFYSTELAAQLTGGSVFFDGANADAANGGTPPKLFAPSTWMQGSSYSHLDYDTYNNTANNLMVYAISNGEACHNPGPIAMGMLRDVGWTTAALNTDPTIANLPDQTVPMNGSADNAIDLWAYANDAEDTDSELTFSIDNVPASGAGVSIDGDRYIDINPTAGWAGQTDVTIRVTDSGGLSNTDTFQVTVSNSAPTISGLPDQTLVVNSSNDNVIDLWTYASDAESADSALTFAIDNAPASGAGVTLDSNRYIDINPTTDWTGQTDVTISVSDGYLDDTDTFAVAIVDKVWTGSASADWHTAGNWNPTGVPTTTDEVFIPDVTNDPVISTADAAVGSLIVERGAVVDLTTRRLTVEDTLTNNGTLKQTQSVSTGDTADFLRITNQAGNEVNYYGVEITPASAVTVQAAPATALPIRLASGAFDPLAAPQPPDTPDGLRLSAYPDDGDGYYLVQFQGPIFAADVAALRAAGARVFDYIPDFTFVVKMDNAARAAVEEMEQVRWAGLYQPAYRLATDLLARTSDGVSAADLSQPADGRQSADPLALWDDDPLELVVAIFRGEPASSIAAQIEAMGGVILDQSQTEWQSKLKVSISPSHLADLAALPGVRWIEEAPQWQLTNNVSADIMGVREVWDTHGLYGDGQTIAVCDTGLDQGSTAPASLHDDFENGGGASRVVQIHDRVGDGGSDVNSGHGTHVAGSVLGNGDLSGSDPSTHTYSDTAYVGMAPEASLVFQAVEDNATGLLAGIPADLNTLFAQAAGSGATLHTNSWGGSVAGMYTSDSEAVDEYVWDHKDFTILFSAGNDGIDGDEDGVVDLYSMGSPATAKNCISVGASENDRPSLAAAWGTGWPTDFPTDPISSDYVADDPAGMAAFSSRGPTLDGRFKPDLVAPGTFIASTRSSLASGSGWGPIDANYMYMGGTSMATPLAAGAATIVRQYYSDTQGITPSAALIKATLVNGAVDIAPGQYGTGADQEIPGARPTHVAGWGRLHLENSLFPTGTRVMTYAQSTTGLTTGVTDTYTYELADSAEPFRVTLAWSDYPGSPAADGGLVNDLDLKVTAPGGAVHYPNNASQPGERLTYDDGSPTSSYYWSGHRVAVRFTPTSYPATLEAGLFALASVSESYPKEFNWYVYAGNDTTGPSTLLASGVTKLAGPGWHVVDMSGAAVTISSGEDFFLAIELPDDDLLWYYDDTAPVDQRSWDYDGSWSKYTAEDYMFNAIVRSDDPAVEQDRVNNLVGVDIASPAAGTYTVTVSGYNVPQGPQPYALVASGAITTAAPAAPAPTVSGITPNTGVNTGTVAITDLAGAGFQDGAAVKLTKTGQTPITATGVTVVSSTTITCIFDLTGAPVGAWNVVVTNPDAQSGTLPDGFTVIPSPTAPTVSGITPNTAVNTGTVHITNLAGTNFTTTGVTTVTLTRLSQTPIVAANVSVLSSSQITCDLDLTGAAAGAWNVVVTNPDGQSGQLSNGFTVTLPPPPAVTAITPNTAANTGTVRITDLAGANFQNGAAVKLTRTGQTPITATDVAVVSSSHITCEFDLTGAAAGAWNVVVTNPDAQSGTLPNGFTVTSITSVTVSIAGNQVCPGRPMSVKRCFDINSSEALSATVRFYFSEAERQGDLSDLLAFHYSGGQWIEEAGPYARGGSGDAQYVEVQNVDDFSPFAIDATRGVLYLPLVLRNG